MHYFGYKYHELVQLDAPTYNYLVDLMYIAKANEDLELRELISYPHLKQDDQKAINRRMHHKATSEAMRAESAATTDQLSAAGIKVGNIADHIKGK